MIQFLRVSNYRSIGKEQSINFMANSDKSHLDKVNDENGVGILPVIPIYGGNATGKTNILRSLKTLKEIVTGTLNINKSYEPCKFIEEDGTSFEIVFFKNKIKYYFKLKYNNEEISEELLYYYPNGKISKIFDRNKKEYTFGSLFEKKLKIFSENLSIDVSFLRTINEFIKDEVEELYTVNLFFNNNLVFLGDELSKHTTEEAKEIFIENENNNNFRNFMDNFYKHLNTGAQGIVIKKSANLDEDILKGFSGSELNSLIKMLKNKKNKRIEINNSSEKFLKLLSHDNSIKINLIYKTKNKEIEMPIEEESTGIQNIFKLGKIISDALTYGNIVVFDELESGFHPILAKKLVELFLKNKKSAQLIFTTHNTNLLDLSLFRRDQIYFIKRNMETEFTSKFISLGDITGIRKSTDIEKAYLQGKYCDSPTFKEWNTPFDNNLKEV